MDYFKYYPQLEKHLVGIEVKMLLSNMVGFERGVVDGYNERE